MSSRRDPPAGSRPTSPFGRRPSVSTHQPPPSTPQFGRDPHLAYVAPPARTSEAPAREFPHNAPKGPKALYNPPILASSGIAGGTGGNGGPPAHSPHKSSFSMSSAGLSPHHGHHYPQAGGQGPSSRGSVPPPGPRAALGRVVPAMPSAGQSRSPVSAPGSGGVTTSGGPVFSTYATSNDSDRIYRGGRRRSSEWEQGGIGRGGRGRSRERERGEYTEYGRGGGSDYGSRGGGAFGGPGFRDRDREFIREGRGGYRGRSRERETFQHRARSSSRERERGMSAYSSGRGDRDSRSDRGGFTGRSTFERERLERERERDRERDRERERSSYKAEVRAVERAREVYDPSPLEQRASRGEREREKRERDAAE